MHSSKTPNGKQDLQRQNPGKLSTKEELSELSTIEQIGLIEQIAEKVTSNPFEHVFFIDNPGPPAADAFPPDRTREFNSLSLGYSHWGRSLQRHRAFVCILLMKVPN